MVQKFILKLAYKTEGRQFYSKTLRNIYKKYYKIKIGNYTQWDFYRPLMIDPNTKIGRYSSLSSGVRIINHNHPLEFRSSHAFFFNPRLGVCKSWKIEYTSLTIGHDVWIGHNAIIMPSVKNIATGAVIAAGAVVNKNIPPYAIVVGNPGRVVRYRFKDEIKEKLLESKWWEKSISEIKKDGLEIYQSKDGGCK